MKKMEVYSVMGDKTHLLLVNGLRVINGDYDLEKRRNKEGLFIPHGDKWAKYECDIDVVMKPGNLGRVNYNMTLDNAEKLLKARKNVN